MSTDWTPQEEAARLMARFDEAKEKSGMTRAEFARKYKLRGGESMLSQQIHGRKKLNLPSAVVYAEGFGVPLHEISPRLAREFAGLKAHEQQALLSATARNEHQGGVRPSQLDDLFRGYESRIARPQITWDSVLSRHHARTLPESFVLEVGDDSMVTPGHRWLTPGSKATFKATTTAEAGDDVLIADANGNLYIRTYQKRSPDHWRAVARNPNYDHLDSQEDGLTLIGVLTGVDWA